MHKSCIWTSLCSWIQPPNQDWRNCRFMRAVLIHLLSYRYLRWLTRQKRHSVLWTETDGLKNRSTSRGTKLVMLKNETENRASGRIRADRDDGTSALPASIINTDRSPSEPLSSLSFLPPPLSLNDQLLEWRRGELERQMAKKKTRKFRQSTHKHSKTEQMDAATDAGADTETEFAPAHRASAQPLIIFILKLPPRLRSFAHRLPAMLRLFLSLQAWAPRTKHQRLPGKERPERAERTGEEEKQALSTRTWVFWKNDSFRLKERKITAVRSATKRWRYNLCAWRKVEMAHYRTGLNNNNNGTAQTVEFLPNITLEYSVYKMPPDASRPV